MRKLLAIAVVFVVWGCSKPATERASSSIAPKAEGIPSEASLASSPVELAVQAQPASSVAERKHYPVTFLDPAAIDFDPKQEIADCHGDQPQIDYRPVSEAEAMDKAPGAVRRGKALKLGAAVFKDQGDSDYVGYQRYLYVGRLKGSGLRLVHIELYEDRLFAVIDPAGKMMFALTDLPIPSPHGLAYASEQTSENVVTFHGLEIADQFKGKWRVLSFDENSTCDLVWLSDTEFTVKYGENRDGRTQYTPVRYFRNADGVWFRAGQDGAAKQLTPLK